MAVQGVRGEGVAGVGCELVKGKEAGAVGYLENILNMALARFYMNQPII